MFFTRITFRLIGFLLILLGVWISYLAATAGFQVSLDSLPDHDYVSEIRTLMAEGRYGEAKVLCEDAASPETAELLRQCDAELNAIGKRIWRSAKAFVSGSPGTSIEEAGAALVSDMLLYGDIRDLILQGYYKVTDQETDPWVAGIALAGLATEAFDAVDWFPALSKALYRAGAISRELADIMLNMIKKSRAAGKLTQEAQDFCKGLQTIFLKSGFVRTRNIISGARSGKDVVNASILLQKSPEATHLIARAAGKNTPEVLEHLVRQNPSPAYLKKLARKGPAGITLFLRSAKTIKKGNFQAFIQQLSLLMGAEIHLISLLLILCGTAMNYKTIKKICKRRSANA